MSASSAGVTSSIFRPSNCAGRSNGIPLSSLLVNTPAISGSPQAVRGGVHAFRLFGTAGLFFSGRSSGRTGAAVLGAGTCPAAPATSEANAIDNTPTNIGSRLSIIPPGSQRLYGRAVRADARQHRLPQVTHLG